MVLFPNGGLGRLLLAIIIITTISYLVVNMVSFGGNRWITYVDVPVRFGLWRVCDTTKPGLCNSWANSFASNITDDTFDGSKPSFIRSSQALEIIALIFYIVAAGLIFLGIIDLSVFPYEVAFLGAAALLLISITFISATLGLMSVQGRRHHQLAFLDWAWWNGLAGLIITIICFFSILFLLAYLRISTSSIAPYPKGQTPFSKAQRSFSGGGRGGGAMFNRSPYPAMAMAANLPPNNTMNQLPPILPLNNTMNQPYNNYSMPDQYFPQNYSNQFSQNTLFPQTPPMAYGGQSPLMAYGGPSPLMAYGGQSPLMSYGGQDQFAPYSYDQSPSPLVSELARQYIYQMSDAQYQRQLLEPYRQYLEDPYLINNYL